MGLFRKPATIQHEGECYEQYAGWWWRVVEDLDTKNTWRTWCMFVLNEDLDEVTLPLGRKIYADSLWGAKRETKATILNVQHKHRQLKLNKPAKWPEKC
jgi:hypothetical protein